MSKCVYIRNEDKRSVYLEFASRHMLTHAFKKLCFSVSEEHFDQSSVTTGIQLMYLYAYLFNYTLHTYDCAADAY